MVSTRTETVAAQIELDSPVVVVVVGAGQPGLALPGPTGCVAD